VNPAGRKTGWGVGSLLLVSPNKWHLKKKKKRRMSIIVAGEERREKREEKTPPEELMDVFM
jgi:hypothetical protein